MEKDGKKKNMRQIRLHKYVGETSRSSNERGLEHLRAYRELKPDSHMLKHYLEHQKNEELEDMKFRMRTIRECRPAFDRQICESVEIQNNTEHHILNSKSEYNRCALPRLSAKLGEQTLEKLENENREEKEKERTNERNN